MKRVLVLSDLHCGHAVGLTPPSWQGRGGSANRLRLSRFVDIRKEGWRHYTRWIKDHGPYDVILCNGDAIDGPGPRSGGTEQITVDRLEQCDMATQALELARNKRTKYVLTYGTAYHAGEVEDWENLVAERLKAKIGAHEWIDVEGWIIDAKHHVGSSTTPYGRHTSLAKEDVWNAMFAERGLQPRANIILRSHVHYYSFAGRRDRLYLTTPALQAMGTKYGARRCSGLVDFGLLVFEMRPKDYSWVAAIETLRAERVTTVKARTYDSIDRQGQAWRARSGCGAEQIVWHVRPAGGSVSRRSG